MVCFLTSHSIQYCPEDQEISFIYPTHIGVLLLTIYVPSTTPFLLIYNQVDKVFSYPTMQPATIREKPIQKTMPLKTIKA